MAEAAAKILVVEDEEKLAKFVQLELGYEGYEVTVANDGLSGLMAARDSEPDLILLDWMMPGLTGAWRFVGDCERPGQRCRSFC